MEFKFGAFGDSKNTGPSLRITLLFTPGNLKILKLKNFIRRKIISIKPAAPPIAIPAMAPELSVSVVELLPPATGVGSKVDGSGTGTGSGIGTEISRLFADSFGSTDMDTISTIEIYDKNALLKIYCFEYDFGRPHV
jgi:hypothetical protein